MKSIGFQIVVLGFVFILWAGQAMAQTPSPTPPDVDCGVSRTVTNVNGDGQDSGSGSTRSAAYNSALSDCFRRAFSNAVWTAQTENNLRCAGCPNNEIGCWASYSPTRKKRNSATEESNDSCEQVQTGTAISWKCKIKCSYTIDIKLSCSPCVGPACADTLESVVIDSDEFQDSSDSIVIDNR